MLEGLVAWILNTYLGKYVELNTDQLSIALLSGKVELENLPLKKDALRHLGLPVEIKTGFIGKIQLQVPVSQIRSAPWVIVIEQLCLVATPLSIDQLRVQDVHIRYEDSVSLPDQTFACGITLGSLIAQSCDQNWLPKFVHPSPNEDSFKILELKEFGLYWMMLNESESLSLLNVAKLAEAMSRNKLEKTTRNYVLPAVSAQAHLKRNRSAEPLRSSMPRYVCDLLLEEVHLSLVDWQYNQIVNCIHGLQDINRLRKYRRYKPMLPVKHDARAWWFYAISCFYPTGKQPSICKPKPTWESCLKKARENVRYVQICKKILAAPSMTLSADEKKIKEEVEWGREYEDLKILKKLVLDSVKLPQLNSNNENDSSKGRSLLVKWFPTWMGWYSGSSETAPTLPPDASKLEGEILQVLADTAEDSTTFRKDAVFGKFNFCLKTGTLGLCTMDKTTNERLSVKSESLDIVYQPNVVRWLIEFIYLPIQRDIAQIQLEAMKLKTKKELMKNWEQIFSGGSVNRSTWELELDITAPQIIFVEQFSDQNSAMAVIDFGKLHLKNNVEKMNENSKTDALDNKNDEDDETYLTPCSTPPVSEGSLSADQTIEGISEAEDASNILNESNLHKKLYDSYCLDLTDLQILIGRAKDNWRFALNKGSSNLHVLDRFSISLQIERRVIYTSDPHYPSVILNAQLPKLVTHLNENNISSARNLIQMLSMTLLPPSFKTSANTNINSSVDVPANQQTLVELMGFFRRVFPETQKSGSLKSHNLAFNAQKSTESLLEETISHIGTTEIIFDFHRLNVLLLRDEDKTAFKFRLVKTEEKDALDVMIRMASVWYTHSPYFILELHSCASEFKQYLSNLAKTIRTAATDMALGLVHVRTEALAQSLNLSKNLPNSVYSSALSISENFTPTRKRSTSTSAKDSMISTPTSPNDDSDLILNVNLDIELDSPVIVLPRSNTSTEVFVAHLGKITINNKYTDEVRIHSVHYRIESYNIDVKDMNIYSLDIKTRRALDFKCIKPEVFYNCKYDAKPILHDTILQLKIEREVNKPINTYDQEFSLDEDIVKTKKTIQVSGSIVNGLKVSLTRSQYRQILDTLEFLSSINSNSCEDYSRIHARPNFVLADIKEEESGISTLNMDPHVRAKMFQNFPALKKKRSSSSVTEVKICFDISLFKIELKAAEQSLINLSFLDFAFRYDKCHDFETNIQISLRSVLMEDLQQPEDSKHRIIVTSSANSDPSSSAASTASRSCPDVTYPPYLRRASHNSLPDHLESNDIFGLQDNSALHKTDNTNWEEYPCTPPPSPTGSRSRGERNLVIVSMLLVDTNAPNFHDHYNSVHNATSVDFNCLDLIITSKSWVIVLDFFSLPPEPVSTISGSYEDIRYKPRKEVNVTTINVKSLNIVIAERDREIAKANISNVELEIKTTGSSKEVDGKLGSLYPPGAKKDYDAQLVLEMASVVYVHTKRFTAEILAFFKNFAERQQMLIKSIQAATSRQLSRDEPLRLSLIIEAKSPIILLPVSLKSPNLIVVDLGQLVVTNSFKFSGDEGTVSVVSDSTRKKCLLDVMSVSLENTDLYMGVKTTHVGQEKKFKTTYFNFGNSCIMKVGMYKLSKMK
ncbi:unnamed protein product [Diabrotica balteata]|uniref:Vacuolar protein sorting-associated protein 13D n=1 Tax=Diabrotica balteata TaxID=107213 RepID=A0A9N9X9J1_DIABA|nr:unnamed protein product [Diabrotica balteata]